MRHSTILLIGSLLLSAAVSAQDPPVKDFDAPNELPSSENNLASGRANDDDMDKGIKGIKKRKLEDWVREITKGK